MKFAKLNFVISASVLFLCAGLLQSCDNDSDNSYNLMQPTALVTVCPQEDQSVVLQLDESGQHEEIALWRQRGARVGKLLPRFGRFGERNAERQCKLDRQHTH